MPSASSGRGRATRERLLAAAVALIPEVGWGAITTRMVAERAGVNSGLVHYHFPSVADLLTDAALAFCARFLDTWLDRLTDAPDVPTGLSGLVTEMDRHPADDPSSLLMAEVFLAATRDDRLRAGVAALAATGRARVADWLRAHGTADPEAVAATTLALLDGLALHRGIGAAVPTADYARTLCRVVESDGKG